MTSRSITSGFQRLGFSTAWLLATGCALEAGDGAAAKDGVALGRVEQALLSRVAVTPESATTRLGMGFNTVTGEPMGDCIAADVTSQNVGFGEVAISHTDDSSQINSFLGLSESAKGTYGLLSASESASFTKQAQETSRSTTLLYSFRALTKRESLKTTNKRWLEDRNDGNFPLLCGDAVVTERDFGGELQFLLKFEFASESEKLAFEASISGDYAGAISAEGGIKNLEDVANQRIKLTFTARQWGGDAEDLAGALGGQVKAACSLDDVSRCQALFDNALNYANDTGADGFQRSIRARPAQVSYTLRSWTYFGGPSAAEVPDDLDAARRKLLTRIRTQFDLQHRVVALRKHSYFGGPRSFVNRVEDIAALLPDNVAAIGWALSSCYDDLSTPPTQRQIDTCVWRAGHLQTHGYTVIDSADLDLPLVTSSFPTASDASVDGTPVRSDFVKTVTPYVGKFGTWRPWSMCPSGTYAAGYQQRVEAYQGSDGLDDDDSGLNSVRLKCRAWDDGAETDAMSHAGYWGTWHPAEECENGVIQGMEVYYEPYQGPGDGEDDSAADKVAARCTSGETIQAPGGAPWGSPRGMVSCPVGTAVCGIMNKTESPQGGGGDDTAMNGVALACCAY